MKLVLWLLFLLSGPATVTRSFAEAPSSSSVYRINPWVDGSIIAAETAGALWSNANSGRLVQPHCPCDANEVNSLDRTVIGHHNDYFGSLSDLTVVAALIVPAVLDWKEVGFSKEFTEDMVVYAEALSTNEALVASIKYSVGRPRPGTYAGDPDLVDKPEGYVSFYSGHTSTTFAALTTAAYTHSLRHPADRWPWYLAAAGGASVAYERVQAGRHFYTDVLAGAVAGTLVGILVPRAHRTSSTPSSFALVPVDGGLSALWRKKF